MMQFVNIIEYENTFALLDQEDAIIGQNLLEWKGDEVFSMRFILETI